jgi:hypothetical protein
MGLVHTSFRVLEGAGEVAAEAGRHILARSREALGDRGRFRIVLAGGTTPLAVYRLLAESTADWADWADWEVYFGDERCLPPEHGERTSRRGPGPVERCRSPRRASSPWPGWDWRRRRPTPLVRPRCFDLVALERGRRACGKPVSRA